MGTHTSKSSASSAAGGGGASIQVQSNGAPYLDSNLIRRANEASVTDLGDATQRQYSRNLSEIDGYTFLSSDEKASAIKKLHELTTKQLEAEARTENPYAQGRGVGRFDRQSMRAAGDTAIYARVKVEEHMREVRELNNSNHVKANQRAMTTAMTNALQSGALEFTVNGAKYRRKSKRAKSFERVYE